MLAAVRHFQTANYYAGLITSNRIEHDEMHGIAIESALQDLALICSIQRPFPSQDQVTRFHNLRLLFS